MPAPVIAALDPSQPGRARDAAVLAARLSSLLGAPLHAVHVFAPARGDVGAQRTCLERQLAEILREAGAAGQVSAYPGIAPARLLQRVSDVEQAECIVAGSGRAAPQGTSALGDVTEGLLRGSNVPVVVVPSGYGALAHPGPIQPARDPVTIVLRLPDAALAGDALARPAAR